MSYNKNTDYKAYDVRDSVVLTNSFVAGNILGIEDINLETHNELIILVNVTLGSLTNASIKIEYSPDNINYYQETIDTVAVNTGVITEHHATRVFPATGLYRMAVPTMDKFIKISALGTGTVTGSLMDITALVGNV